MPSQTQGALAPENQLFEKLISVEDLADALGKAPKTIRNYVVRREIPFVMIGRKVMFRPRSIEAWLERKEFKPWQ